MKLANLFLVIPLLTLTSCASYLDNMYQDLDRQEKRYNGDVVQDESLDNPYLPNQKRRTSTVYNRPGRDRQISTNTQKLVNPDVKRQYVDEKVAKRRVSTKDLMDNQNDGSLWGNADTNSFLFATSKSKSTGDIVQINVFGKLKNEITQELQRAFPETQLDASKATDPNAAADPSKVTATTAPEATVSDSSLQDKISGVVVEEVNREHLLIKGRKNIVYKNKKRMVEVQALVSRRDISDDDSISSESIIESNVSVVR